MAFRIHGRIGTRQGTCEVFCHADQAILFYILRVFQVVCLVLLSCEPIFVFSVILLVACRPCTWVWIVPRLTPCCLSLCVSTQAPLFQPYASRPSLPASRLIVSAVVLSPVSETVFLGLAHHRISFLVLCRPLAFLLLPSGSL